MNLNFHGEDVKPSPPEDSLFHVIPVPLEHSVSYGSGTAGGPHAILEASTQLELLACGNNPADHGIYTAPSLDCSGNIEGILHLLEQSVNNVAESNALPVIIGGEHTLSLGTVKGLIRKYGKIGICHFDAHADLRNSYEGSAFSHACVMRRIHELDVEIFQLGTRSYSEEEEKFRNENNILFQDSETIWKKGVDLFLPVDFPELIYISFDVDALDSSIMPATGTPVPGGLSWYQAMWLIERILQQRICIGFDVVEFSPIVNQHAFNFSAAQLTYNIMSYILSSAINSEYWKR